MKKETLQKRTKIANDIMYYIYTHIETNIDIEELSIDLGISKFHMHRIFKEAFGKNIYESIKSIRLQKASNLLLTNKYSTISNIVNQCGYSSQSSFIKIFNISSIAFLISILFIRSILYPNCFINTESSFSLSLYSL